MRSSICVSSPAMPFKYHLMRTWPWVSSAMSRSSAWPSRAQAVPCGASDAKRRRTLGSPARASSCAPGPATPMMTTDIKAHLRVRLMWLLGRPSAAFGVAVLGAEIGQQRQDALQELRVDERLRQLIARLQRRREELRAERLRHRHRLDALLGEEAAEER